MDTTFLTDVPSLFKLARSVRKFSILRKSFKKIIVTDTPLISSQFDEKGVSMVISSYVQLCLFVANTLHSSTDARCSKVLFAIQFNIFQ